MVKGEMMIIVSPSSIHLVETYALNSFFDVMLVMDALESKGLFKGHCHPK